MAMTVQVDHATRLLTTQPQLSMVRKPASTSPLMRTIASLRPIGVISAGIVLGNEVWYSLGVNLMLNLY